ncbi:MAG: hypothetical protein K8T26_12185 [Lentisphaerae bacterium]|nr:hypothetical protein [Lentisphaerota bacterium]
MHRINWSHTLIVSFLMMALAMVSGCAQPKTVDAVMSQARAKLERGDVAGAQRIAERALAAPDLDAQRPQLFTAWLQLLVEKGQAEAAAKALRIMAAQSGGDALADRGYTVLANHLATNGHWQALLACTESLDGPSLSPALAGRVALDGMLARIEVGDLRSALARMPALLEGEPSPDVRRLVMLLGDRLMRASDHESLTALQVQLRTAGAGRPAWAALSGIFDVSLAVAERQWDAAMAKWQVLNGLGDEMAARDALAGLLHALAAAGEEGRVDRLCVEAMAGKAAPRVQAEAAYRWLLQARRLKQPATLVDRMGLAIQSELPPSFLLMLYREFLYDILGADQIALAQTALAQSDQLAPRLAQPEQQESLRSLQFDVAFMAEDYARVLALLDGGLAGRDADWHAMARNKVLAHQALKAGQLDEAVARFRDFMSYVDRTWTAPAPDPSSGLRYTRDMALGFNARRIGDILLQQGATNEATASFREALTYYANALTNVAAGSREYQVVTNELGRLAIVP